MNLITADSSWISFLIVIVTIIFSVIKSNAKKPARKPAFPSPDFEPYADEEKEKEELTSLVKQEKEDYDSLPGDYYSQKDATLKGEKAGDDSSEEETDIHAPRLDIRQAIISSEILKRPEF